jgi:hypothetical protein
LLPLFVHKDMDMPNEYGSAYSATDATALAAGSLVDAGLRRHRNVFNFADAGVGGTATPLRLARPSAGTALAMVFLQSDVNASGINLSIGTAGEAAKYSAAAAGPNATRTQPIIKIGALDDPALASAEEILLTPSGNWPSTGTLVTEVYVSKR